LGVGGVNGFDFAAGLRPGGYHAFTMLGKIAVGRPLYRYQLSDYRASGWAQTEERRAITGQMASGDALSGDAILLLRRLRDWCQEHGVRSAYSMPWAWTAPAAQRDCRRRNIHFLVQMATILPVLKDPRLGADPDQDDFADANWHLTASAAQLRTDELAQQILTWNVWTVEELLALEKTP
jgi:hypothetical protein